MGGGISEMLALDSNDSNKALKESEQAIGKKPTSSTSTQHLFQLLGLDSCPI